MTLLYVKYLVKPGSSTLHEHLSWNKIQAHGDGTTLYDLHVHDYGTIFGGGRSWLIMNTAEHVLIINTFVIELDEEAYLGFSFLHLLQFVLHNYCFSCLYFPKRYSSWTICRKLAIFNVSYHEFCMMLMLKQYLGISSKIYVIACTCGVDILFSLFYLWINLFVIAYLSVWLVDGITTYR